MSRYSNIWKTLLCIAVCIVIFLLITGCATTGSVESLKPVCEALGPPHVYNAKNKNSPYHAGPVLATRLHRDNNVGSGLSCPGY